MDKIALVTGGTRGIGQAISMELKQQGVKVIANYCSNAAAAQCFSNRTDIPALQFDVSDFNATCDAITIVEREWGPIDILVNNAGVTRDGMLHKMGPEDWSEVLQKNLTSCFNTCRLVVPRMRERGFGRIINISSLHGQTGQYGQTNYAAAKAGMLGFTKAPVLFQSVNVMFSAFVAFHSKAPCAGNGRSPCQTRQHRCGAPRKRPSGWLVSAPGRRCVPCQGLRPLAAERALPGTLTSQLNTTFTP